MPITLIIFVVSLLGFAGLTVFSAFQSGSMLFSATSLLFLLSALLLALRKPAAQLPFFIVAAIMIAWWSHSMVLIVLEGWPHMDPISSAISLVPGIAFIAYFVAGSVYVFRFFKHPSA
jgi:hypothetical protein